MESLESSRVRGVFAIEYNSYQPKPLLCSVHLMCHESSVTTLRCDDIQCSDAIAADVVSPAADMDKNALTSH